MSAYVGERARRRSTAADWVTVALVFGMTLVLFAVTMFVVAGLNQRHDAQVRCDALGGVLIELREGYWCLRRDVVIER